MKNTRGKFYIGLLAEASQEFETLREPEKLARAYLLTAMGALGCSRGFVVLINPRNLDGKTISRGIPERETARLRINLPALIEHHLREYLHPGDGKPYSLQIVNRQELDKIPLLPPGIGTALRFGIHENYIGLAGFGEKITREDFEENQLTFLLDVSRKFLLSLRDCRFRLEIEKKDKMLAEKSEYLHDAARQVRHQRNLSEQRLFQLQGFREMFSELRNKKNSQELLDAFLLLIIGIFSLDRAVIVLFDREKMSASMAHRGGDREKLTAVADRDIRKSLREAFQSAHLEKMRPLSAVVLRDLNLFQTPLIPVRINSGLMFYLDDNHAGLIGLGEKITRERFSDDEKALFPSLASHFMVFLQGALALEKMERMREQMERQNKALDQSEANLGVYKSKIELLEIAKARFRSILQTEQARAGRVSFLDFVVIIGVGILLGLLYNLANPAGIDVVKHLWNRQPVVSVDVHAARSLLEQKRAIIVDARPTEFFNQAHVHGAINLPLSLFDFVYMMRFSSLSPDQTVIVYGHNISRQYDQEVASKLILRGHRNVVLLESGLSSWQKEKYPVASQSE